MLTPDTVYGHRPWGTGPNPSNEERMETEELIRALMGTAPVTPVQRPLFPPRFGYRNRVVDIRVVLTVDRVYNPRADDFTGTPGGYSGSSIPSLNWW